MFSLKPDYEEVKKRYEAFWERQIIDRPLVSLTFPVEKRKPLPEKSYKNFKDQWLDIEFRSEAMAISLENTVFYADALPVAWPNLGPEIFSAWCGCDYEFGETTTWSKPCIFDWEKDTDRAVFSDRHPLFKVMTDFTNRLLDYAKGNFIVGLTDFHPGGDHLAALRDPQELAIDLIEHTDEVKAKLKSSQLEYFQVYDRFYNMLRQAGMPITSWTNLICDGRFYIPSNDFSIMISKAMFDDIFLPGIIDECSFYDRSIYHLDGPGALRHLDSLLGIKQLDAIQYVCGAGNYGYHKWADVFRKIQKAGKALQLPVQLHELPLVFETLKPEGVWLCIGGVSDRYTAEEVMKRITKWA
jgi:hypothetical protein